MNDKSSMVYGKTLVRFKSIMKNLTITYNNALNLWNLCQIRLKQTIKEVNDIE